MKKIYKVILIYFLLLILNQCAVVEEGFSSQKKKGSDEFLVEKKAPLVMPPNYEELPIPNQDNQKSVEKSGNIKKLINKDATENSDKSEIIQTDNSLEKNILDKIKK